MKQVIKDIIESIPNYEYLMLFRDRVKYQMQDDESAIRNKYKKIFGRDIDLDNPKTFNEKIQWRILRDRNPLYTELADKYRVREFIKEKIGEKYLIKLLEVYDSVEDIDYNKLPNQFVLKCSHDSGSVIICKNKNSFDREKANRKLKYFLRRNFYYVTREWHYKDMKPRIICEEFISDNGNAPKDYKFHMFKDGDDFRFFIQVDEDRFESHKRAMMDKNWEKAPFILKREFPNKIPKKPEKFNEMINLAKKIAESFECVRIDFYEVNGKIYFGEVTFTPGAGTEKFYPDEWDYKLGEMWKINK